jgi:NADPH-dependent 2,4-dienoyl-CoA reductase/sulfur reductase-like enzyme
VTVVCYEQLITPESFCGVVSMGREQQLQQLKAGDLYDLLVIGGGATGCGVALDAASRGLTHVYHLEK